MKKTLIIALFLISISIFSSSPPADWMNSSLVYKTEISSIKKNKIPMILYVYADWCPYCKKMNAKLRNSEVRKYLKGFVKIAINAGKKEKSRDIKKIMSKYHITGFPSLVLIYPSGKHKKFYTSVELSDKKFLWSLKKKIGKTAYNMSKKQNKKAYLDKQEIADLYGNNGKKPKIIEVSENDNTESGKMRAYKIVTENPDAKFHNNSGDIYLSRGKYDTAKAEYFEALKYDKKSQRAYYSIAKIYYLRSKRIKGFKKLQYLKKSKTYIGLAEIYSGIYVEDIKLLKKQVEKAIKKENKKYKVYK